MSAWTEGNGPSRWSAWRPIETAPKDYTTGPILVIGGTSYSTISTYPHHSPTTRASEVCWDGSDWVAQDEAHDEFIVYSPTHWMPIPSADAVDCGAILQALYDSEINYEISCFWDGGFKAVLGDPMNGERADGYCNTFQEAAIWLAEQAVIHFPKSEFSRAALSLASGGAK